MPFANKSAIMRVARADSRGTGISIVYAEIIEQRAPPPPTTKSFKGGGGGGQARGGDGNRGKEATRTGFIEPLAAAAPAPFECMKKKVNL